MLRLKLHILLFLCPGRLLPFLLFLPDTLLPAFQALHYGWLFPRLGGLPVLLRRQNLIEPVAHAPQRPHVRLYRFQLLPFAGQGGGKVFAFVLQLLAAVGRAGQVGLNIAGGCPVCVQLAPVGLRKSPSASSSRWRHTPCRPACTSHSSQCGRAGCRCP